MKRITTLLGITLLWLCAVVGCNRRPPDPVAKDFDPDVAAAWKKAGAQVGWCGTMENGYWVPMTVVGHKLNGPDALPSFYWPRFEPGVIVNLPAPSEPFALFLQEGGPKGPTDSALKELVALKNLRHLDINRNPITNAGLKELAGLTNLQVLDLSFTQVTDAGLKELTGLQSLQTLNLASTQVSDAGLKELAALKSLRTLGLGNTKVTPAGIEKLRADRPNLTVYEVEHRLPDPVESTK